MPPPRAPPAPPHTARAIGPTRRAAPAPSDAPVLPAAAVLPPSPSRPSRHPPGLWQCTAPAKAFSRGRAASGPALACAGTSDVPFQDATRAEGSRHAPPRLFAVPMAAATIASGSRQPFGRPLAHRHAPARQSSPHDLDVLLAHLEPEEPPSLRAKRPVVPSPANEPSIRPEARLAPLSPTWRPRCSRPACRAGVQRSARKPGADPRAENFCSPGPRGSEAPRAFLPAAARGRLEVPSARAVNRVPGVGRARIILHPD